MLDELIVKFARTKPSRSSIRTEDSSVMVR